MTDDKTLGDKLRDFAAYILEEEGWMTAQDKALELADEADELESKVINLRERLKFAINKKQQRAIND